MSQHRHYIIALTLFVAASIANAQQDNSSVTDLVAQGQKLAESGNHSAAVEKYNQAISRDGSSPDAHAWKAASLISLNRLDEAESEIALARKSNPDEFTYQMIAGRLEIARGNIDAGSALFEKAAKVSPKNAGKVYADLAAALAERKDDKLAAKIESALKSAANADPPHLNALFDLGQSYVSAGKTEGRV